jgi:hypothetical protein
MKCLLVTIVVLVLTTQLAFPQASVSSAELRGQVADVNGAAVAGATITITNVAKGTSRSVTSDENGNFVFLAVPPATYNLKVEAQGFAPKTLTDVHLDVGQVATIPISLAVGGVQAEVNVAATTEGTIEVERSQQSSVINERQIDSLPINRRNYLDFALLTPGVSDSDSINDSSDFRVAQTPQSGLSFGGNNGRGNSVLVDGASADTNSGAARDVIGQEGVQEFQVNRNAYNAEFGGASGGIVNIVSKTGTNLLHGSLFGYFRDDRFDSRNAFDFTPAGKASFDRQQYGGSLGGRITRDKTFFFTSAERLDEGRTTFVNLLIDPTIFNTTSTQTALFNFLDTAPVPQLRAVSAGLRAALTTTQAAYPRTVKLFNDASGQFPFDTSSTIFTARVDHTFSSKDSGYVRFNLADSYFENTAAGALNAVSRGRTVETFTGGLLLSETHFFSPTTINEVKAQYSYLDSDVVPNDLVGPELNIEGFGNFGRDIFLPSESIERRYEISDNIAMVRGTHTLKFGGQYLAVDNSNNSQTFFGGRFNFGNVLPLSNIIALNPALGPVVLGQINTFLRGSGNPLGADNGGNPASACSNPSPLGCPNGLADSLDAPINALQSFNLNLPIVYQQGFGESGFNAWSHRYSFYGQDTWKVRPNFTFNFGVRYFLDNPEFFGKSDRDNFQPRLGFSWDPTRDGKTVVRGGYGLFTGQVDIQIVNVTNELNGMGTPSNINIVLATATSGALGLPTSFAVYQRLLQQGVIGSRVITAADLAQFGVVPGPGKPLEVRFRREPNYENPFAQQASLGVQRDLGSGYAVEVSYLFTRGLHITRNRDINQFKRTGPPNPLNPKGGATFIRFPTAAQVAAGLTSDFRNPLSLQDNVYESSASSFYHAGTIQLSKRFTSFYTVNANYTYSKSIDEVTDFNSDFSAQNPLDIRLDRGLSAFDQRHRLVINAVLASPVTGDSPAAKVFSDWTLAGIYVGGSGRPFNLLLGFDSNGDGRSQSDRPGQAARNTGKGESFHQVDVRLARRFTLAEDRYLEFTVEAFNVFNRTNYTGINNVVGCGQIGQFGSYCPSLTSAAIETFSTRGIKGLAPTQPLGFTAAAAARQLQFGARFNF